MDSRGEIGKVYDPKPIEDRRYAAWMAEDLFRAHPEDREKTPFCIVIPPPNVTGSLHLGHALDNTLQDIVCRWHRMRGDNVLWLPGTDHAGIATQNVVERQLASEGKSRRDLGREAFVERVWEWKEQYGNRIISQLKKMGASCDWSRERFTMDEGLSRAVREVFVRLYQKDLIYKGKYIINWCPRCHTALSDLEVDHEDSAGKLYFVSYPFEDGEGTLTVATTRPETILGDVAIAVHPRDERNRPFVGRRVRVPLTGRTVPVLEDNMVDPEFGTGCVKITPAHDPNDFLVGQRHGLEQIQVIDGEGIMNEAAGIYAGKDRFEARKLVVAALEQEGLLLRIEDHQHAVGHCYRCKSVVEPFLSEQWFVRAKPLADRGVQAVREGRIRFVPEQWTNTYYQWMENVRDWCISRQLWWGHRIPAWTCAACGHITVASEDPSACEKCGATELTQDEDVLDTWFSSALWPFSTLGWPEKTPELATYYPTSLLVTGFDIIFFWVSRMIMMGLEFMDEVPFREVYIHALIRDEHGQKMSKSKGNVVDPLDIIDEFGADALRFTLAALTGQGRDILLGRSRIETYRFFMNKLWNASRFALMNLEDGPEADVSSEDDLRLHDRWILRRCREVAKETTSHLSGYFYAEAARGLYDFVWSELCDWYLEMAKPALRGEEGEARRRATQKALRKVFRTTLLLLHPFVPFVTEELWMSFGFGVRPLDQERWPEDPVNGDEETKPEMVLLQDVVRTLRNLRAEARIAPSQTVPSARLVIPAEGERRVVEAHQDLACLLAKVDHLEVLSGGDKPARSLAAIAQNFAIYLEVGTLLDVDAEIRRLEGERAKLARDVELCEHKLKDEKFLSRAPEEVVCKERDRMREGKLRMARIAENLESLR